MVTGTKKAQHPERRFGYWILTPFSRSLCAAALLLLSTASLASGQFPGASTPPVASTFEGMIDQLSAPNPDLRVAVAIALGKLGSDAAPAVPALIEAMKDERFDEMFRSPTAVNRREQFALAISRIGEPARESLILALDDSNGLVRVWSAYALYRIDATQLERITDVLLEALRGRGDQVPDAAWILQQMEVENESVVVSLLEALPGKSFEIRCDIAYTLASVGPPDSRAIQEAMSSDLAPVRICAAFAWSQISPQAIDETIVILVDTLSDESPAARKQAVWAIGQLGPPAEPAARQLIDSLANVDFAPFDHFFGGQGPFGRYVSDPALTLAKFGEPLLPALESAMTHENIKVRVSAAIAALQIDATTAPLVQPILAEAQTAEQSEIRMVAEMVASRISTAKVADLDAMIESLKVSRPMMGRGVPANFREFGDRAIPPLLELLYGDDGQAARRAAQALATLGPTGNVELEKALDAETPRVRLYAIEALARLGPAGVQGLRKATRDSSYTVRRAAAYALMAFETNN